MQEALLTRFLHYVKTDTMAYPESVTFPSSAVQLDFAKFLAKECEAIGLCEVSVDANGYVMATLPSNTTKATPTIGFIAHMDTAPDFSGKNVKPQIIENYDGKDILLNPEHGVVLSPKQFAILNTLKGETLITTDGTTLLGADDKAGIAEILTAMDYLVRHPEIPHGTIRVAFTPDEEVGRGVDFFDVKAFGADFAYTIDGGAIGEVQSSNFNANNATVEIKGISIHPGGAKDKMKNSVAIGCEFHSLLPADEVPEKTSGLEGFYHLHDMEGSTELTTMHYILRDHDREKFEIKKATLEKAAQQINTRYGEGTATVTLQDMYYNMQEIVDQFPEVMALAEQAILNLGMTPHNAPIRGGTDGSRLSFMGLPCPNLFTGGYNAHGKFEFAVLAYMVKACETIVEIAKLAATHA